MWRQSLAEKRLRGGMLDGTTAEGQDGTRGLQQCCDEIGFKGAKVGLTVTGKKLRDGRTLLLDEDSVYVEKLPGELVCKEAANRGLARSHKACEDDALVHDFLTIDGAGRSAWGVDRLCQCDKRAARPAFRK